MLSILLVIAFCGLGYRLVDLQVQRHPRLLKEAQRNTDQVELLNPRRGDIRDIRGKLLATSLPAKTVFADPAFIGEYRSDIARAIAPHLRMSEWTIFDSLKPAVRMRTNDNVVSLVTNRYVVLERKVPVERWLQVSNAMANLTFGEDEKKLPKKQRQFFRNLRKMGINADQVEDTIRVYPNKSLAAHVLGFAGTREIEINNRRAIEPVGIEGIELAFNSKLNGAPGWRISEKDRRQREIAMKRVYEIEPRNGLDVILTIDTGLQHIVEDELAKMVKQFEPESATVVVVRPATGEIAAMATLPTFDSNQPGVVPAGFRRNRAIMDVYEPGSTFKIVVVAAAYEERISKPTDMVYCENGSFTYAGKVLRDDHRLGWLSVEGVITHSSNIGAAKIGLKLGSNRLYSYVRRFGFGELSGVSLYGEVRGIVYPVRKWSGLSITRIPMGHEVAVTPLQITMAMAAIANEGKLMRPKLVDRLEDSSGQVAVRYAPEMVRQVISKKSAHRMVEALKTVVSTNGTAVKAKMEYYTAAGKTGTAQKAGAGGYVRGKYIASFIGFFPADRPELVISVIVNEPKTGYYGGQVCAPCFREIALRSANYLNIQPDIIGLSDSLQTQVNRRPARWPITVARK